MAGPRTGYFKFSKQIYLIADYFFFNAVNSIYSYKSYYMIHNIQLNGETKTHRRNLLTLPNLDLATSFFSLTFEEELGKFHI